MIRGISTESQCVVFEIWNWSVALFVVFSCKIPSRKIAGGEDREQEFMMMSVVLTCGIVLVIIPINLAPIFCGVSDSDARRTPVTPH
jgi:hypothetical protein